MSDANLDARRVHVLSYYHPTPLGGVRFIDEQAPER